MLLVKIESIKNDKTNYQNFPISLPTNVLNNSYFHLGNPHVNTKELEIKNIKNKLFQNILFNKYYKTNKNYSNYILNLLPKLKKLGKIKICFGICLFIVM